jgi:DNA polymerase elongation subunit (family B)
MIKSPRVLLVDIETAPTLGYFWGKLYDTNIIEIKDAWYMLSYAWKWQGEKKTHVRALSDYPEYDANLDNDFFLVKDLRNLFDEADVLIAHNGDRFDIRKAQARMIRYKMAPPSRFQTIDTLKAARKYFQFDSNRLDALGQYLKLGRKLPTTGFDLWKRTMRGDRKAWAIMKRYNKHDVDLLEKVYEELRPWMTTHPNLELFHRPHVGVLCPNCQSENTMKKGFWYNVARKYQQHQCRDCGRWFKGILIKT